MAGAETELRLAHVSVDLLEEYAAKTLPRLKRERVEKHLHSCPECRDRLQAEIEFGDAMRAAAARFRKVSGAVNRPKIRNRT